MPNRVNVLVVDDSPAKVMALAAVLEQPDLRIVPAYSGDEALRRLLHEEFAVVLLDVSMPILDGFQTAALIRQRPASTAIPIIFVTAYDSSEKSIGQAYSLGAVDFIFAPVVPEILKAKVAVFVDLFRKTRAVKRQAEELDARVRERTAALEAEVEERLRAEHELLTNLHHLKTLSEVSQAVVGEADAAAAVQAALDVVRKAFDSDRALLVQPDPAADGLCLVPFLSFRQAHTVETQATWAAPLAGLLTRLKSGGSLLALGQGGRPPADLKALGARSGLLAEVKLRKGPSWMLILLQCSYARTWTAEERGLFVDVSVRVGDAVAHLQAQLELQRSEERFRLMAELQPQMIWSAQPDGRIDYVNSLWCRYTGMSAEDALGAGWSAAVHPADLPLALDLWHQSVASGEPYETNLRYRRAADGAWRWHLCRASAVRDEAGRILKWYGVSVDIDDQRRVQEALERSRERYQSLVDSIDGIVWECDPQTWRYNLVSHQAVALLGHPIDRWLSTPGFFQANLADEDRDATLALARAQLQNGAAKFQAEYRRKSADGRLVWLRDHVTVLRDASGQPQRLRGVMVDISERKKTEEALRRTEEQFRHAQKMEAIGRLAGGVAHDFNNLLTAINGNCDVMLSMVHPDGPLHECLTEVRAAGDRAASLTRQLLAYSRKQVLAPRIVNLNAVVGDMDRMLRRVIGEDVRLVTRLDPELATVRVDPGQMQQVLLNLAVNARDAMPGGGQLTVETATVRLDRALADQQGLQPGDFVLMTVTDTGKGMDAQVKQNLFEPFFTTKQVGEGTGLGLSTVYGIVQQSGGFITVESEVDQGAKFFVYLPVSEPLGPTSVQDRAGPENVPKGCETVLVVEDEESVRRLVARVLRSAGYNVLEAKDGHDAMQASLLHEGPIHLLLTDIVMPGMGGHELAQRLSQLRPDTRVLFMSGYTDDVMVRQGVRDANAWLLSKPFLPGTMARTVREVLDAPKLRAVTA